MTSENRTFATLDSCPSCGGVFAEPGESQSALGHRHDVAEFARLGLAEIVGPSTIGCPSAHGRMVVYRVKGQDGALEVDVCATCAGVFFDAGEPELLKSLGQRAGELQTASGARFSAPPADSNQSRAIAEAQAASTARPLASFWSDFVLTVAATFGRRGRW
jgi:Zn-finger nucleic acid-binding protein